MAMRATTPQPSVRDKLPKPNLPQPGQTLASLVPSGQGHAALPPPVGAGPGVIGGGSGRTGMGGVRHRPGGTPTTTPPWRPGMQPGQSQNMMLPVPPDQSQDMMLPVQPDQSQDTMPSDQPNPAQTPQDLLALFQQQAAAANAANEARYQQGMGLYDTIAQQFAPGGGFGRGLMQQYERQKERALANQQQQLIASGLGGTTLAGTAEGAYEETVGTPFRLQLADLQAQKYAEALGQKAGFIERREDTPPDPRLMADLAMGAASGPGGTSGDTGAGAGAGGGTDFTLPEELQTAGGKQFFETGLFSSNPTVRRFAQLQGRPGAQNKILKKQENQVQRAQTKLDNLTKRLEKVRPDSKVAERLQGQIAEQQELLESKQNVINELLESRRLMGMGRTAGGAVGAQVESQEDWMQDWIGRHELHDILGRQESAAKRGMWGGLAGSALGMFGGPVLGALGGGIGGAITNAFNQAPVSASAPTPQPTYTPAQASIAPLTGALGGLAGSVMGPMGGALGNLAGTMAPSWFNTGR